MVNLLYQHVLIYLMLAISSFFYMPYPNNEQVLSGQPENISRIITFTAAILFQALSPLT